jgi:hypothetical protein
MHAFAAAMQNDVAQSQLQPTPRRRYTRNPRKPEKHPFRWKRHVCNARQAFFAAEYVQVIEFYPRLTRLKANTVGQHEIDSSLPKLRLVIFGIDEGGSATTGHQRSPCQWSALSCRLYNLKL